MQVAIHFLVQSFISSSVVVKSACGVIVTAYLIGLIPNAYGVLSITPALLLPPNFQVWTLVTGLVVERSIINVLINLPAIILCGQHLEPLWGALELLKFITITSVGTALMTSFVSLAAYAITHRFTFWAVQFSGMAGVLGGLTVAFKQLRPDQRFNMKYKELRVHDLPIFCIIIFTLLAIFRLLPYTQPIMMACGVIVGWTYLRFYQSHGKGMRGDMSEGFSAATLLPTPIRPAASVLSEILYRILVRLGLCQNPVRTYDVGGPSSITISLPGSDPADAERRRKKALRALNERLTQMQQKSSQQEMETIDGWPLLENESTPSSTPSASVSETNNKESHENEADSDSDKNSQESFVKVPKGTDSDPLSD